MKHAARWIWFNVAARVLTLVPQKIPTLLTGLGSIKLVPSELGVHHKKKPLIVTDATLVKVGVVGKLTAILANAGIPFAIFDEVLPDPTYEICEKGLTVLRENGCDSVIALGGGSVIDAAKLIRMGATHKKRITKFAGLMPFRNSGLPFICIPTTAGTGSEATAAAVITDSKRHRKATVLDPRLPPDTAILDPGLTTGLPPAMTAATGMDALTHAVEAYTNTLHYSDVDVQAIEAVRLIFSNLRTACAEGGKIEAREAMLRASHLAGRAFTRGFVGYVHAVAHRFGERYHIPHGLANAITLPYFLDLYRSVCPERLADLAAAAGIRSRSRNEEVDACALAFVEAVRSLNAEIGIPEKAVFLREEDIVGIAADAFREAHGTPYPVPIVLETAELERILRSMRI
jgi:alcohol dehydrogenase